MKVVFAGPSLFGADIRATEIDFRGPAAFGDISKAVIDGATVIGLIDGHYETEAAPWHKEILWALSQGVIVYGGASLGALRAAECARFGMRSVGEIAQRYIDATLIDDGDVAVLNGPAELGYVPLTEALVDMRATLVELERLSLISQLEVVRLEHIAASIFFKERTAKRVIEHALPASRWQSVERAYSEHRIGLKQIDAKAIVDEVAQCTPNVTTDVDWTFSASPMWRAALRGIQGEMTTT